MSENLFSYGTLQCDDVQLQLLGRLVHGTKYLLTGYKIASIEITDESFLEMGADKFQKTLIHSTDDFVEGTVLEITTQELLIVDKYEPVNYQRVKVKLDSDKEAWIYFAVEIT